jgi:hypothetical protein
MYVGGYWLSQDTVDRNPELKNIVPAAPPSKYHNSRSEAKGMTFQSGHEASGVAGLILLEEHKQIFGLRLQVRFPLQGHNTYVADAVYLDEKLAVHVVDFKGVRTKEFKIKAKLFLEKYGQAIEEM